jgi:hypothetical protein
VKSITRALTLTAFFVTVFVAALRADTSLANARRAQALLGPDIWSQVIRIENTGSTNHYPATVHALVFELADILWFYSDLDGTQSFSLHKGRLAQEKADFAPLLRAISPGFYRWSVIGGDAPIPGGNGVLLNGCFIESAVALRDRLRRGGEAMRPRLLSYYVELKDGSRHGHTVLAYETGGRVEVIDSSAAAKPVNFPALVAGDPLMLARAMRGRDVTNARYLPVDWPAARADRYTTVSTSVSNVARSG